MVELKTAYDLVNAEDRIHEVFDEVERRCKEEIPRPNKLRIAKIQNEVVKEMAKQIVAEKQQSERKCT